MGIDSGAAFYYVVTYFATNLHQPAPEKEHPRDAGRLLHMLFISTMQEVVGRYNLPYGFCCGYKIATAVFWGDDADSLKQTILDISENVMELMTNSIAMHMQVTVSSSVCDFTRLPEAYEETHRLRSFAKSINSTTAIICQEDLAQDSSVLLNGDFIRQEQILINTILVRKYDAVPSMVAALLSGHVSTLRKNYALAQSRLTSISNILLEGVRMSGLPDLSEIAEAEFGRAGSVEELIAAATNIYSRMDHGLQQRQASTDYVDIACDYIAQNLSDQNLNVSAICEATGISVQKLTRLFQNRFGMAIAEYANACRIKRAKELLANPELTAVSIAQQIGYSNADTFTRNFKKIEGVTPTEYRKAL